jgi:retron-type reverse transcriptase
MKTYNNLFNDLISLDNLFFSWKEFKKGKSNKLDVLEFELNLEQNIFQLHKDLQNHAYKHGGYKTFRVSDPKPREINKASIRDRIVHHAICHILIDIFEPTFIAYSFSCRKNKGTHKGVYALESLLRKTSKNNTKSCFVLKCDIKKFFENIDHNILSDILFKRIKDQEVN